MKYELINFCEFDENAEKSYCAIHNVPNNKNLGDITKVKELSGCDFLSYGFPCQDISTVGNRSGIKQGTRSGLLYEVERLLGNNKYKPKFLLMENVKALTEKNHIYDFKRWLEKLNDFGYINYWQVLNSSDYNIPQNRNRVFCLSIRKDINNGFEFPLPLPLINTLDKFIDNSINENLYGQIPLNSHQEWKQEMYERYIEASNGICSGVYTNQSKSFGFRPPLAHLAKTLKANAFDVGFVKGNLVRNFTDLEYWKLQGFSENDYNLAKNVVIKPNILKKQAGNSITINVLVEIYKQIYKFYPNDFDNLKMISLFSGVGAFEMALKLV